MRLKILHIIIVVFFLIALLGLVYTQVFKGLFYYRKSQNNCIRIVPQQAKRGLVLDRNAAVLADNRMSFNLAIIPQELKDKEQEFLSISRILDKDKASLEKEFRKNQSLPFVPAIVAKNIDKKQAIILEQKKSGFPGVIVEQDAQRFYPFHGAAAHAIGYVGEIDKTRITKLKDYGYKVKDIIGYSGLEEFYDAILRGQEGGAQIEVDNRGIPVRVIADRLAQRGRDITLTLDLRIQKIASDLLEGKRGAIIVMDPNNGEILAMVSSPTFDPNIFVSQNSGEDINGLLNNKNSPLLNRAVAGLYSPGSVFKAVVAVAALESKKIDIYSSFFCNGKMNLGGRDFNCWSKHNDQNLEQAIMHSCNVFFYHLGLLLGADLLNKYAVEFGLGSLTGIDLPVESKGLVPSRSQKSIFKKEAWFPGDSLNFSIGQGDLLLTPLQAVKLMAIIANNGIIIKPHLLKAIEGKDIELPKKYRKVNIKAETLARVKSYLLGVVKSETGTAHLLAMDNLSIAGKTGTVQTAGFGRQHAWFVGFAPFEKPKIVFCVFLEHGGYSSESCVIAKEMLQEMLKEKIF